MKGNRILRGITSDGSLLAVAIDAGNLVHTAQSIHATSPVATAALGRLLMASSMMGVLLKQKAATITLKINGGGPLGTVTAVADSRGNCRGCVEHPEVTLPLREDGKLDVGGAIGVDGMLAVIRDTGEGDPYVGQTAIATGEIAEDVATYYARSEQIPTVCALGVLVDKEDHEVLLAGGLLIQALPGADDATLDRLEQNIQGLEPVTTMLAKGMSVEEICRTALAGFEMEILEETEVGYACPCSKERVERALATLPPEELTAIAQEDGKLEAKCHYCGKSYFFSKEELEELAHALSEPSDKMG